MYEVEFYINRRGTNEIKNYLLELQKNKSKNNRIKFNKIVSYIDSLKIYGFALGEPMIKHIDGDIWELRSIRDRILFAYYKDNKFILLHIFMKDTQKTPKSELDIAKNNFKDYIERKNENEI
ncbi:MAG: type II toxin-antitoxin system RelE/ParE family toxin [Lachnospiraceae bacterium]|jgi:phage-related protein|nr:type II toxin-antitoxin system RelE/ParE family toxin [Lachnospiraceae bacterium]